MRVTPEEIWGEGEIGGRRKKLTQRCPRQITRQGSGVASTGRGEKVVVATLSQYTWGGGVGGGGGGGAVGSGGGGGVEGDKGVGCS